MLHTGGVRCPVTLDQLIETRLLALAERQHVDEATVRLADDREASPRYRASLLVRVPGPDIHAASCDHTLRGAVERVLAEVEAQVAARHDRRRRQWHGRTRVTAPFSAGRRR